MAFDPKAALFAVVVAAAAASLGGAAYLYVRMIRQVNEAEGQQGRIPWSLILSRGQLLDRHAELFPNDGPTRARYFVLVLVGGGWPSVPRFSGTG